MQSTPIRIGFIGAGGIARSRHLPGLQAVDGVELTAVANRTRASSERVAAEWGFKHVCDDWRDLVRIADSLGIVGTLKNGAIAVLDVSGSTRFAGSPRIELFGSDGTLVYEVRGDRILAARRDEPELRPVPIVPEERREWRAEADFVNAIRERTPVTPDFEEGLRYMEVTEAIYRAARTGQTVMLPLG
jgi:predicted dehydrogenase